MEMNATTIFTVSKSASNSLEKAISKPQKGILLFWLSRYEVVINVNIHRGIVCIADIAFWSTRKNFEAVACR